MLRFVERHLPGDEKGATALFVALCLTLLMGIAAVAIDLGFGFNERRQSQTAADMAVMAGATEIVLGGTQEDVVNQVLAFARANTNITYSDEEWRDLWLSCADPDRIGFDVGTGTPVDFQPMPAPAAWGGGDLECISSVASYLRVRIPDQVVETTFARVMGFQQVITSAAAVARVDAGEALGSVVPFGIPANTASGEVCLSTSSQPILPCRGNVSGAFGSLQSEFFGDYFGNSSVCHNPTSNPPTMAQNVALGIDHAVAVWPAANAAQAGVSFGSPHPGNNFVRDYPGIGYDDCRVQNGAVVPDNSNHVMPPNAMLMESGFGSRSQIFQGLVEGGSNNPGITFPGRLTTGPNPKRNLRNGANTWGLDNKALWDYLIPNNAVEGTIPQCDSDNYDDFSVTQPADLLAKLTLMHECLQQYEATYAGNPNPPLLFDDSIGDSPRLVWTPQFWHLAASSQRWQPIHSFRLVFISGMYLDCHGNNPVVCGIIFYPDDQTGGQITVNGNAGNAFSQLTAFMFPIEAVPEEARPPIPGEETAHTATLFR